MSIESKAARKRPKATDVVGKDPNKQYRLCRPENVEWRKAQGYQVTKPGEGAPKVAWGQKSDTDAIKNAEGLVLMEMPAKQREELRRSRDSEDTMDQKSKAKAFAEESGLIELDPEESKRSASRGVTVTVPELPYKVKRGRKVAGAA